MQYRAISETNMEMFVIIYEEGGRWGGGREGIKMRYESCQTAMENSPK